MNQITMKVTMNPYIMLEMLLREKENQEIADGRNEKLGIHAPYTSAQRKIDDEIDKWIEKAREFSEKEIRHKIQDTVSVGDSHSIVLTKDSSAFEKDKGVISISVKGGSLYMNVKTGFASYNGVEKNYNPEGNKFSILLKLAGHHGDPVTHEVLLGSKPKSKHNVRILQGDIKTIKKELGILPAKKSVNQDFIKNVPGYGYRLLP